MLKFSIQDTGVGIHSGDIEKLFKLFGKIDLKHGINQSGVGLGLTTSKQLIQKLGGDISLISYPLKGSTFTFTIKAEIDCKSPTDIEDSQTECSIKDFNKMFNNGLNFNCKNSGRINSSFFERD